MPSKGRDLALEGAPLVDRVLDALPRLLESQLGVTQRVVERLELRLQRRQGFVGRVNGLILTLQLQQRFKIRMHLSPSR